MRERQARPTARGTPQPPHPPPPPSYPWQCRRLTQAPRGQAPRSYSSQLPTSPIPAAAAAAGKRGKQTNVRNLNDVYGVSIRGGYCAVRHSQQRTNRVRHSRFVPNDLLQGKCPVAVASLPQIQYLGNERTDHREGRRMDHVWSMPGLWVTWFGGLRARDNAPVGGARGGRADFPKRQSNVDNKHRGSSFLARYKPGSEIDGTSERPPVPEGRSGTVFLRDFLSTRSRRRVRCSHARRTRTLSVAAKIKCQE